MLAQLFSLDKIMTFIYQYTRLDEKHLNLETDKNHIILPKIIVKNRRKLA